MIFVNGELLPAYAEAGLLRRSSKVIALVGSGGKTSTMFRLAREFAALGESVAVTTTTQLYKPETGFVFCDRRFPIRRFRAPSRSSGSRYNQKRSARRLF